MRFYFTEEDPPTEIRARDIRAALVHAHHRVVHGRPLAPVPPKVDVWMHGIGIAGSAAMNPAVANMLLQSQARVVIFQACDHRSMCFEQIPTAVAERAELFLRSHWPSDRNQVPAEFRDRVGFLPPMINPLVPAPGEELSRRNGNALFFGTRTGMVNLANGKNARDECVRLMLNSRLPFQGGIVAHDDPRYASDPHLVVPKISEAQHRALLADAKICLAPWGNHPITYRLFEGLAARCLVVAQSLRETSFIDGGLEADRHYVEVAPDLSNLTEKVSYYLSHLDEAQRIADAGHRHFETHFAARGKLISSYIFENTVASWGSLYRPAPSPNPLASMRSQLSQWFPKWY
ncbi:MAG TPA: glycosyltransferase [Polyangiaceae bacterium]|nr:glycosyltransferase [Polyangiaceae bacterium]